MRTLTLSLIIVVLIATVGLGWLFDQAYQQYSVSEPTRNVDAVSTLERLGTALATTLNVLDNRHQFVKEWPSEQQFTLTLSDVNGFPLPKALLSEVKQGVPLLLESDVSLSIHYYLSEHHELLVLTSPLINIAQVDNSKKYFFTVFFYLALILLFLLWAFPLIRHLINLKATAKAFGQGQLSQRITSSKISYIRDIEIEFNQMAQRIENLVDDVKLLSSAVSHDLRTPLARIQFGLDTLEEEDDPDLRRKYTEKINRNIDEMTDLVETLLNYARLDQAMIDVKKDSIDLGALLESCIENKKAENVDFTVNKTGNKPMVLGDKGYLKILINNLLQNAINYGKGQVEINISTDENNVHFSISDNGNGVPETQKNAIFKPFFRGDHQHSSQGSIKGHGVGLAIVKRIVDWHHSEIYVDKDSKLLGARFNVCLPIQGK